MDEPKSQNRNVQDSSPSPNFKASMKMYRGPSIVHVGDDCPGDGIAMLPATILKK
jgi:hypothetical protein